MSTHSPSCSKINIILKSTDQDINETEEMRQARTNKQETLLHVVHHAQNCVNNKKNQHTNAQQMKYFPPFRQLNV